MQNFAGGGNFVLLQHLTNKLLQYEKIILFNVVRNLVFNLCLWKR